MAKGKEKCWTDDNCFGITYPGTGNSWLSGKKGVAICRSMELTMKTEKDWNVFLKCNSGMYVTMSHISTTTNLIAMIRLSS